MTRDWIGISALGGAVLLLLIALMLIAKPVAPSRHISLSVSMPVPQFVTVPEAQAMIQTVSDEAEGLRDAAIEQAVAIRGYIVEQRALEIPTEEYFCEE